MNLRKMVGSVRTAVRDSWERWKHMVPPGAGEVPGLFLEPCPAVGVPARYGGGCPAAPRPLLAVGGAGATGGTQEKADLEAAIRFLLTLRRQCGMYLYATTKALEFPYMGSPTIVVYDETDIYKFTESVESLFLAAFNTFSELLSRDAVHKRVGIRLNTEEYYDLAMFDRVHKLILSILIVFQVLCQSQTAFRNVHIPARLEAHAQG